MRSTIRLLFVGWNLEALVDDPPRVRELRLVVTAPDYDEALRFYRDALGLKERAAYASPGGRVTILEAGRATLELTDPGHAAFIDQRVGSAITVAPAASSAAVSIRENSSLWATTTKSSRRSGRPLQSPVAPTIWLCSRQPSSTWAMSTGCAGSSRRPSRPSRRASTRLQLASDALRQSSTLQASYSTRAT
jgi:hypothetical protein